MPKVAITPRPGTPVPCSTPEMSSEKPTYKKTPYRPLRKFTPADESSQFADSFETDALISSFQSTVPEQNSSSSNESSSMASGRSFDDTVESSSDISFGELPQLTRNHTKQPDTSSKDVETTSELVAETSDLTENKVQEDSDHSSDGDESSNEGTISAFISNVIEKVEDDKSSDVKPKVDKEMAERGRPSACLFVASLAAGLSDTELAASVEQHFSLWGKLMFVKVLRDASNRPYAFVQYYFDNVAQTALEQSHNNMLNGRRIRCEHAKVNRTLFITVFAENCTRDHLMKHVEEYGEIEAVVPYAHENTWQTDGRSEKSWFVQYVYRDDAIQAYAALRERDDWKIIWAQNLSGPGGRIDRKSVFVKGLAMEATRDDIMDRFGVHGDILSCHIVHRSPQVTSNGLYVNRSFAFLSYQTEKAAASAIQQENHSVFFDEKIIVRYKDLGRYHDRKPRYFLAGKGASVQLAPPPVLGGGALSRTNYLAVKNEFTEGQSGTSSVSDEHQTNSAGHKKMYPKFKGKRPLAEKVNAPSFQMNQGNRAPWMFPTGYTNGYNMEPIIAYPGLENMYGQSMRFYPPNFYPYMAANPSPFYPYYYKPEGHEVD